MVEINKGMLLERKTKIDELDEILDSVQGGASAGKRAVTNALVKETEEGWTKVVAEVKQYLAKYENDPDAFAGIFAGVRQNLLNDKELNEKFDAVLDTKSEEIKAATPNYTEDELKSYDEERRDEVKKFKQIKELLSLFSVDVSDVEDPKRRTGARGKRGPRMISLYTWTVDGTRMPAKEDSLAGVASANEYESVKELREALNEFLAKIEVPEKTEKFSTKNPPDEIDFTMKNGKLLHGEKPAEVPVEDEDDDEDDEEVPTETTPED